MCRYHIKEMIIFLRKIQHCSVSTPASTLNNTGVMLNSVDTSDNTGYSTCSTKYRQLLISSPNNDNLL